MDVPEVTAKAIVSAYHETGWFGSSYTMNLYRGCSHGCIYCDSRSACYHIDNFDEVRVKADALRVVARDLKSKRKKGIVITGSMSDPYNPFEARLQLTRRALELLQRHGFGVAVDTKSALVARDIDLLHEISAATAACVSVTVTTFDDEMCRAIEKNVCPTSERLRALEAIARAGIDCGVLLMPILPFLNDTQENIASIARAARDAGAKWVYPGGAFRVTMRARQREYFYASVSQETRRAYADAFGEEYFCPSPRDAELWEVLGAIARPNGIMVSMDEIERYMRGKFDARAGEQIGMFAREESTNPG